MNNYKISVAFKRILMALIASVVFSVLYIIWIPVGIIRVFVDQEGYSEMVYTIMDWVEWLFKRIKSMRQNL
jgi:hypothetical protein